MNYLFVCSRNKRRSLTAEAIFKRHPVHSVRSAGTSESARIKISEPLIHWADVIFVMERKHKQMIQSQYHTDKDIIILDIPDEYEYMDEELVEILKASVLNYL